MKKHLLYLFVLILFTSSSCKPTIKKPIPKKHKGLLAHAKFAFVLEDTDPASSADLQIVLSSGLKLRLSKNILFTNNDLINGFIKKDEIYEMKNLWLIFSKEAAKKLKIITGKNIGKRLAIIIDGAIWIAPVIKTEIPDGKAVISGRKIQRMLDDLVNKIKKK